MKLSVTACLAMYYLHRHRTICIYLSIFLFLYVCLNSTCEKKHQFLRGLESIRNKVSPSPVTEEAMPEVLLDVSWRHVRCTSFE